MAFATASVVLGSEFGCVQGIAAERGQTGEREETVVHNPDLTCHWICGQTGQGILGPVSRETKAT